SASGRPGDAEKAAVRRSSLEETFVGASEIRLVRRRSVVKSPSFPSPPSGAERVRVRWGRHRSCPPHPALRATLSPQMGGEGFSGVDKSGENGCSVWG